MDEYLREHHKPGSDEPAEPPKHRSAPVPERIEHPVSKPMFPVSPKAAQPEPLPEPAPLPEPRQAPVHEHHPTKHHRRPKRRFGIVKILAVILILGLAGGSGAYYYLNYVKSPSPLPQQVVKSASFPVYYPSKLPGAYKYQLGSGVNQSNLVTYRIADGTNGVVVTQQPIPSNFDASKLPNFKSIQVNDGSAVIGISSNATTVVYSTPTTLINMTAVNGISQADMVAIAQSLATVKK